MKLSIITIGYNNRQGYLHTFKSVAMQSCRDFEYIVVDGASTDGSMELIREYAANGCITKWVSESDGGIYDAMNKGIAMATGEYMLFLNSGDTLYEADVIDRVLPLLAGKDFYVGDQMNADSAHTVTYSPDAIGAAYFTCCFLPHQATFIRAELLKNRPYKGDHYPVIADFEQMFYELIMQKRSYEHLPFIICLFDLSGISQQVHATLNREQLRIMAEYLPKSVVSELQDYHKSCKSVWFNSLLHPSPYEVKVLSGLQMGGFWGDMKMLRNVIKHLLMPWIFRAKAKK